MLLDEFEKYNLTRFIPRFRNIDLDAETLSDYLKKGSDYCDEESGDSLYSRMEIQDTRDPYNPDFDEYLFEDEDPEGDVNDDSTFEYFIGDPDDGYMFETIGQLRQFFDREHLTDEEFLELRLSSLFGLTEPQMKFLDGDLINSKDFKVGRFIELLHDGAVIKMLPDPEQRIRYCTAVLSLGADPFWPPAEYADLSRMGYHHPDGVYESTREYVKRIILAHDLATARHLLQLLKDYYRMWPEAKQIDLERAANEGNDHGYPLFPKPSHLQDLHDKAMRDHQIMQARKEAERAEQMAEERRARQGCEEGQAGNGRAIEDEGYNDDDGYDDDGYDEGDAVGYGYDNYLDELEDHEIHHINDRIWKLTKNPFYRKLLCKGKEYSIVAPLGTEDIRNEGRTLNHCVEIYAEDFSNAVTLLYFLRRTKDIQEPFYTLEVLPSNGRFVLRQCFGKNNTTEKPDDCRQFIEWWAKRNGIQIECEI